MARRLKGGGISGGEFSQGRVMFAGMLCSRYEPRKDVVLYGSRVAGMVSVRSMQRDNVRLS